MKFNAALIIALFAAILVMHSSAAAATLSPVVLQTTGTVATGVNGGAEKPVQAKDSLPVGSIVKTGPNSTANIALTPEAGIELGFNSQIQIVEADSSATSTKAEAILLKGSAICTLKPKAKESQSFRLSTGKGEYAEAVGTVWKSTSEGGKKQVTVTSGTVSWSNPKLGGPISLPAGSVMVATYGGDGNLASLAVTDLTSGNITIYPFDGSEPTTRAATPAELAEARASFDAVINPPAPTPGGGGDGGFSGGETSSLVAMLAQVNKTLQQAGLEEVKTPPATPAPDGGSNDPDEEVSGTSPN